MFVLKNKVINYDLPFVLCCLHIEKGVLNIFFRRFFDLEFAGKENAFLIQNIFPVIEKYFDHIHTVQDQPVTIHKKLNKLLVENLNGVLAMYNRGVRLTFTDIRTIKTIMEKELNEI